jgi:hypothetical protein
MPHSDCRVQVFRRYTGERVWFHSVLTNWLSLQAFCENYPDRKLVRKWVAEKIKQVAERGISGWVIKSAALGLPEGDDKGPDAGGPAGDVEDEAVPMEGDEKGPDLPAPADAGALRKFLRKVYPSTK